ncbi:MAG: hypothetical protein N2259_00270 [Patescibacteria group bacterium]|nr:hypothetical protein [Patescibacteria group bacterium]
MKKPLLYRFFEVIPAGLVWLTFFLLIIFSFLKPIWVLFFIIILSLLWLCRIFYLMIHLLSAWRTLRQHLKINWWQKLSKISDWQKIYHLIFLPTYKEPLAIIESTFQSLKEVNYPKEKFIVVLAGEERDKENFLTIAEIIKKRYEKIFFQFLITLHPKDLPDEIPGKGSNLHFAGHQAKKIIDQLKIPYENIIVSAFDIDTRVHREYFSYLTYTYLTVDQPTRKSYQPVAIYNNNIWESPFFSRIVSRGTTFWLLSELSKRKTLFSFSSHAMSFKALVEVGFWQKDIVTEDSRIALQCLVHYRGDYQVIPLYIPVSMDTVYAGSFWRTVVNQYKQVMRWGWGIEHFPYMVWQVIQKKISFKKILPYLWKQLEGSYSWATIPILLFAIGRLPLWLAKRKIETTVFAQNVPFVMEWIMTVAMVGLLICAILSLKLLPPRKEKIAFHRYFFMFIQWLFFPLTTIIFGSIPVLQAQTKLMLNKPFSFRVTEKKPVF